MKGSVKFEGRYARVFARARWFPEADLGGGVTAPTREELGARNDRRRAAPFGFAMCSKEELLTYAGVCERVGKESRLAWPMAMRRTHS